MELNGVGIWSTQLRFGDPAEAADAAAELDELGFAALWFPDAGGPVFDTAGRLLAATRRVVVATGVLNLWMHSPEETAARAVSLTAEHGERFLLGIGVSHADVVDAGEPGRYQRPLAAMGAFLDALDAAQAPVPPTGRVLAALGPKMLALAANRARGIHAYLVTPEHTRLAREVLGAGPLVLPEQTVILCGTRQEARAIGADWLRRYLTHPNYANNLLRLGFSAEDLASVSDRLFDAMVAWGDEEAIMRRVDEHRAAGADHVALQVLTEDARAFPREQWRRIAAAV
ncbi:LLM class F420-dependent oxidoreductase [Parafrankia colletiae]|uniref:LLM class F420-dependent oxidoreductase n=1 Tax=Parafrankia colletiae TaxID=573497 RepID=A0A1S1PYD0_9ACTN|nr:LLM class F420-dependent oxidoreductase [Parafrankia colletiae]MCK9904603.1 LLM class F420-dependent oxidoreductase [Frankia sp. Cpl3]OHV27668.1 LLM class F420-dependent oxidoreductase [Parafrankia colletiae]